MKHLLIICLLVCSAMEGSHASYFERDLQKIADKLRSNIYSEYERDCIESELISLLHEIENAIKNPGEKGRINDLDVIQNDVSALLGFVKEINDEHDNLSESQFLKALELLDARVVRISDGECSYATFYELAINKFKAIFLCNELTSKSTLNSAIRVTFSTRIKDDAFVYTADNNQIDLCCNYVRCLFTQSDKKYGIYPEKILNIVCTKRYPSME